MAMLVVRNLAVSFTQYEVGLKQRQLTVITQLDLEADAGEVVAVVGASGSGKSLLAHALLGILPPNAQVSGELVFKGQHLDPARIESLRGREIALIPQSVSYLDPLQRVGPQVQRAAQLSGAKPPAAKILQQQAFARYDLKARVGRLFPFQVSGGMARRVLLATATVGQAELIVADEPTPGLHPTVVVETLKHLRELADEGKAVILITHDIEAALQIADRVAVFYAGTTVEVAAAKDFDDPEGTNLRHPYTKALWQALPQNKFRPLAGTQPPPDNLPSGCLFADRCPLVIPECEAGRPILRSVRAGLVRCIRA